MVKGGYTHGNGRVTPIVQYILAYTRGKERLARVVKRGLHAW